ncbi:MULTISPECIES: hypothetical protein [unclassified Prochlorococcus]|uniref:hypothetical protein n=1 Tax=unclassified Prochlorococcus TaxID=2627481 RepID=UPI0005651B31|nr:MULTISPECIES: hypothetical protein [unclassified Prochlorococcus]
MRTNHQTGFANQKKTGFMPTIKSAWHRRQLDTGWGVAIKHIFPPYALYYAITRRTRTPILYLLGLSFFLTFFSAFLQSLLDLDLSLFRLFEVPITIIYIPFIAKHAIKQARHYAKYKLRRIVN